MTMFGLMLVSALLVVPAVLMVAGVIEFGGEFRGLIATAMIVISFMFPFIAPPPNFDDDNEGSST